MTYNDYLYLFSINPFQLIAPKLMPPRLFWNLISEENSWINKLRERNDIFIEGNRGCGKSTLLYYFKVNYLIEKFKNLHDFLSSEKNKLFKIIGFYFDCKTDFEQANITYKIFDNDSLKLKSLKKNWCTLDLIITILRRVFIQISDIFQEYLNEFENPNQIITLINKKLKILLDLDESNLKQSQNNLICFFKDLCDLFLEIKRKNIKFVKNILFNDFQNENIELGAYNIQDVGDFFEIIRIIIPKLKYFTFFLLFDDGTRLNENYQEIINLLIKSRDHNNFCLKIVLEKGWKIWKFYTSFDNEDHIQFPHDYDFIDINELYSNNLLIYTHQIKKICKKRFDILNK